jgi:hypothetical protein
VPQRPSLILNRVAGAAGLRKESLMRRNGAAFGS